MTKTERTIISTIISAANSIWVDPDHTAEYADAGYLRAITPTMWKHIADELDGYDLPYWCADYPVTDEKATYSLWVCGEYRYARQPEFCWGLSRLTD